MSSVAIIGVGLLGTAIAERLLNAGFHVLGFDIDESRRAVLTQLGGEPVHDLHDCAQRCDAIVLCLPDSSVTATVLPQTGTALIIDTTTGSPEEMASFGRNRRYLDATIAGSSRQVSNGEAIMMIGGEDESVQAAADILDAIAPVRFHVGPCGAGARMKLIVNLVLGLNRAVLAEGLAFAETCGVDAELALAVLKASPAYSRAMDVKGGKMIARDYTPEARLRQHHKDVRLMLNSGATLPLTRVHDQLLEEAEQAGYADADNSAIIEILRKASRSRSLPADPRE